MSRSSLKIYEKMWGFFPELAVATLIVQRYESKIEQVNV